MATETYIFKPKNPRDSAFPDNLKKASLDFLQNHPAGDFYLDLSDVRVIFSRTIGVILYLENLYSKSNRAFILKNITPDVKDIFDQMGLTNFLKFSEDTLEQETQKKNVSLSAALKVDYETFKDIGIFKFSGSIHAQRDSAMFMNIINKIITDNVRMLIDMREITFIDSLAIGVVVRLLRLIKEGKAEVRFFGASKLLKEILDVGQLTQVINIYGSKEEALKGWI
jgi:anti-anti-sigma factor